MSVPKIKKPKLDKILNKITEKPNKKPEKSQIRFLSFDSRHNSI